MPCEISGARVRAIDVAVLIWVGPINQGDIFFCKATRSFYMRRETHTGYSVVFLWKGIQMQMHTRIRTRTRTHIHTLTHTRTYVHMHTDTRTHIR